MARLIILSGALPPATLPCILLHNKKYGNNHSLYTLLNSPFYICHKDIMYISNIHFTHTLQCIIIYFRHRKSRSDKMNFTKQICIHWYRKRENAKRSLKKLPKMHFHSDPLSRKAFCRATRPFASYAWCVLDHSSYFWQWKRRGLRRNYGGLTEFRSKAFTGAYDGNACNAHACREETAA